jgi:hypothetical protein
MDDETSSVVRISCPGVTRAGRLCGRPVAEGADFCHYHDPARAEQRRRIASKAGKSRPLSESARLRRGLFALIEEVKAAEVDPKIANTIAVLANSIIGTLRLDSKLRELEDIEIRLRDLERAASQDNL